MNDENAQNQDNTETPESILDAAANSVENTQLVPKTYKVKVDGQEVEVDESELLRGYQLASASNRRFQQAAAQIKQVQSIIEQAKSDPSVIFQTLGLDQRAWAEQLLIKQIEQEMLSPEQKAQREKEQRLAEYEKRENEERQRTEQARQQALYEQAAAEIDQEIAETIRASGLRPTPRVIARLAEQILAAMDATGQRIPAQAALRRVQGELQSELLEYASSMPVEQLLSLLPGELVRAVRKHFVDELKAKVPQVRPQKALGKPSTAPSRGRTIDDILGD